MNGELQIDCESLPTKKKAAPFFSIVVPVYNVAPYLRECLNSVLAQTFADWECLCVDDGSTDESGAILDEYAKKDHRFRVFHKKNGGVSAARNLALDNVKGEWIGFLDGDDIYRLDLMETCKNVIKQFPTTEMVRFNFVSFIDGIQCRWPDLSGEVKFIDYQNRLTSPLWEGAFWGRFYQGNKVKDVRFKPYIYGEDLLWKTEVVVKLNRLVDIGGCFYGYRQRQGSAMSTSVTLRGRLSSLYWRYDVWKILKETTRCIEQKLVSQIEEGLTGCYSQLYFTTPRSIRGEVWSHWITILKDLGDLRGIFSRRKFLAKLVAQRRSQALAFCVFYLPYFIKCLYWRVGSATKKVLTTSMKRFKR